MIEPTTIDTILDYVEDKVAHHIPFSPSAFLDLAHRMTALMGNLDDSLIDARMKVNKQMMALVETGSVAKAKVIVEASDEFREYLKLEAKRERAAEFIRLAKKRVELQSFDQ